MGQPIHERVPWHTPWTVSFHLMCHGATMKNTIAFAVERATPWMIYSIYHGSFFCELTHGRKVHAGIVGHE